MRRRSLPPLRSLSSLSSLLLVGALAIGLGACDRGASSAGPSAAPATVDAARMAIVDRLGDRAPLVGVFDPAAWPTVHARLGRLFERAPPGMAEAVRELKDEPAVVQAVLRLATGNPAAAAPAGLDPSRPIAFSLFEPGFDGPPGSAIAAIDFDTPQPLRHEVILPATDAAALEASLKAALGDTPKTAAGYDLGIVQVGIKAEGDLVRIAALMPATSKQADRLWPATSAPSVRTPALLELASPGAALGMLVRPWRLRAAWGQHGANQMAFALTEVAPDMRMALFAKGLSIVLTGATLMSAERPEFEDAVVRLTADDAGIALEGTHAITALLQGALTAGKPGTVFATRTPPLAESWQRVDLRGLLDGIGPRPAFAQAKRLRDVGRGIQECGLGCTLHTLLRAPFGTARTLVDLAPPEVKAALRDLPTATQIAFVGMDGRLPRIALAADVPKSFDTSLLRAGGGPIEVHLIPRDERAALLVGFNVDPRTVFDHTRAATAEGMSHSWLDVQQLASMLGGIVPKAELLLAGLGPIVADARHPGGGRSLTWRLHLTTEAGKTASAYAPRRGADFAGPIRGFEASPGDPCLARAVKGAVELFDALASVASDSRGALFGKGADELKADLDCAAQHPTTRAAATGMRRLFVRLATLTAESGRPDQVLPFVEAQCAASEDAWICSEAKRIKALPRMELPEVKLHCSPTFAGGRDIQVTADGIRLDGQPAELGALAALSEPVTLAIDRGLTFDRVRPVLEAIPGDTVQVTALIEGRPQQFLIGAPFPKDAPKAGDDVARIRVGKDEKYADVVKRIDALRAKGVEDFVIDVDLDDAPRQKGPLELKMPAPGEAPVEGVVPDRFKTLLADTEQPPAGPARWRIEVAAEQVKVIRVASGVVRATEALERGDALRAIVGDEPAVISVAPEVPWQAVAQVLATTCEQGQLVAGGAVEAAPVIEPGAVAIAESRSKADIQAVIREKSAEVRMCYEQALLKDPALTGKLKVVFTIDPDGRVEAPSIEGNTGLPASVGDCITARMKGWRFSPAAKSSRVAYPFIFSVE